MPKNAELALSAENFYKVLTWFWAALGVIYRCEFFCVKVRSANSGSLKYSKSLNFFEIADFFFRLTLMTSSKNIFPLKRERAWCVCVELSGELALTLRALFSHFRESFNFDQLENLSARWGNRKQRFDWPRELIFRPSFAEKTRFRSIFFFCGEILFYLPISARWCKFLVFEKITWFMLPAKPNLTLNCQS